MSRYNITSERRKELLENYKQTPKDKGIYQIRNIRTGKVLVGSSADLRVFMNRHVMQLKIGSHKSKELQHDWNTQGADDFRFEILEVLKEKEDLQYDYRFDLHLLEEKWRALKKGEAYA